MTDRNAPLTDESIQRITDWATELRRLITDEALNVSANTRAVVQEGVTGDMLGVTGELAKAFDALNQAAVFVNVAINHVNYAKERYENHTSSQRPVQDAPGVEQ